MNKYRLQYETLDGTGDAASCESFAENIDEAIEKFKNKFGKNRKLLFAESLDGTEVPQVFLEIKSVEVKRKARKLRVNFGNE